MLIILSLIVIHKNHYYAALLFIFFSSHKQLPLPLPILFFPCFFLASILSLLQGVALTTFKNSSSLFRQNHRCLLTSFHLIYLRQLHTYTLPCLRTYRQLCLNSSLLFLLIFPTCLFAISDSLHADQTSSGTATTRFRILAHFFCASDPFDRVQSISSPGAGETFSLANPNHARA